jgi:hypothetical protein
MNTETFDSCGAKAPKVLLETLAFMAMCPTQDFETTTILRINGLISIFLRCGCPEDIDLFYVVLAESQNCVRLSPPSIELSRISRLRPQGPNA